MPIDEVIANLYIRKPHTVEAIQLTHTNVNFLANWCGGIVVQERQPGAAWMPMKYCVALDMPNLSGSLRAHVGDYITKDEQGVFSRVDPSIFDLDYQNEGMTTKLSRLESDWRKKALI